LGNTGSQPAGQRQREDRQTCKGDDNRQWADIFYQGKQRQCGDGRFPRQIMSIDTPLMRGHDCSGQQEGEDKPADTCRLVEQQEVRRRDGDKRERRPRPASRARPRSAHPAVDQSRIAHAAHRKLSASRPLTDWLTKTVARGSAGSTSHQPSLAIR
jgi:hypothetical protein